MLAAKAKATRGLVLVVDDDPIVLEVVREKLQAAGYEVEVRERSLGTSEWIVLNRPDLVLLDVMMPALDGSNLAQLLKQRGLTRKVGVILHSRKAPYDLARLAARVGALGAISKLADDAEFMREFERLASAHRARR